MFVAERKQGNVWHVSSKSRGLRDYTADGFLKVVEDRWFAIAIPPQVCDLALPGEQLIYQHRRRPHIDVARARFPEGVVSDVGTRNDRTRIIR
jgi:hypothetical protein